QGTFDFFGGTSSPALYSGVLYGDDFYLDDSANVPPAGQNDNYEFTGSILFKPGSGLDIGFSNLDDIVLSADNSPNNIYFDGFVKGPTHTHVTITGGGGIDNYSSVLPDSPVRKLNNMQGTINVVGESGELLTLDDTAAAVNQNYQITSNSV